ncbi:MAG: discoidin domain-containing protein, partial [Nitrososphaeraceae archaeon]
IFTVKNGASTSIAGTLALSTDAKTVTFKPSSSLGFSTSYTATITTGVNDKAGNAMTAGKTWSFTTSAGNTPPPPSPPTSNPCNKLSVSKITEAGGTPSLGPKYAIDDDLATRWSEQGLGSSLTLDFGKKKTICNLEVSWYRGTERISKFVIGVSKDGKSFTDVFSGTSSGSTNGFERYEFPDTTARYVKITVNGNTLNDWASILEISVFGDPNNTPTPNPTPPPTPPPSDSTLNIAAAGDWGCSSQAQSTLDNIVQKTPEVVLALGDLSYKDTPDCWLKLISPIKTITKFSMGNHEEDEGSPSSLPTSYLEKFGLGTSYYSFNYRNIHFLMLNSEIAFNSNSPQYSFAKNDLAIASTDAAIKWIIVGFHTPMYTSPSKHPPNVPFRDTYHPLFDKYDVDLVLQAHNHNYQRSNPMTFNDAKSSEPLISSSQKNDYKVPAGEIYLVVGTAGRSLYSLNGKASFNVDQFEEYGFLDLEISNDGKILKGKFYSDKDGSINDQFTITK